VCRVGEEQACTCASGAHGTALCRAGFESGSIPVLDSCDCGDGGGGPDSGSRD
jgi:hypothetical protein